MKFKNPREGLGRQALSYKLLLHILPYLSWFFRLRLCHRFHLLLILYFVAVCIVLPYWAFAYPSFRSRTAASWCSSVETFVERGPLGDGLVARCPFAFHLPLKRSKTEIVNRPTGRGIYCHKAQLQQDKSSARSYHRWLRIRRRVGRQSHASSNSWHFDGRRRKGRRRKSLFQTFLRLELGWQEIF